MYKGTGIYVVKWEYIVLQNEDTLPLSFTSSKGNVSIT